VLSIFLNVENQDEARCAASRQSIQCLAPGGPKTYGIKNAFARTGAFNKGKKKPIHHWLIFTASYIDDLDGLAILKVSVDRYNADHLPFYIAVPPKDPERIYSKITTGAEAYELNFVSHENILGVDNEQKRDGENSPYLSMDEVLMPQDQ